VIEMQLWQGLGNFVCVLFHYNYVMIKVKTQDCPHRSEKVRTVHNVQQAKTVEDMGRSVPKIYAALNYKQAEFQSHMIEVEGKINNQPIGILIDSGASHSYLNPKMVKRFHLPRSKLGKP
jgi:predicted aspartyl protease